MWRWSVAAGRSARRRPLARRHAAARRGAGAVAPRSRARRRRRARDRSHHPRRRRRPPQHRRARRALARALRRPLRRRRAPPPCASPTRSRATPEPRHICSFSSAQLPRSRARSNRSGRTSRDGHGPSSPSPRCSHGDSRRTIARRSGAASRARAPVAASVEPRHRLRAADRAPPPAPRARAPPPPAPARAPTAARGAPATSSAASVIHSALPAKAMRRRVHADDVQMVGLVGRQRHAVAERHLGRARQHRLDVASRCAARATADGAARW